MAQYMNLPLASGGTIMIEAADDEVANAELVGRRSRVVAAARTLADALGELRHVGDDIVAALAGMTPAPANIAMTFGVNMTTNADIVIIKAGVQATFSVTLTWNGIGS